MHLLTSALSVAGDTGAESKLEDAVTLGGFGSVQKGLEAWKSQVLTWGAHCNCLQQLTHGGIREVSLAIGVTRSESLKCRSDRRMLVKRAVHWERICHISCQELPDLVSTVKDLVGTYFVPNTVQVHFRQKAVDSGFQIQCKCQILTSWVVL